MSETSKLFPLKVFKSLLKLPDNFHGPTKAFKRAT